MLKENHLHNSSLAGLPHLDLTRLLDHLEVVELLLDQIPQGILIARAPGGSLLLTNRLGRELRGQFPDYLTLEGYNLSWTLYSVDQSPVPAAELPLAKAFLGESIKQREYLVEFADGRCARHVVSAEALRQADGEIFAALISFADITRQKQNEESLQHSEQHYRELFENANDIIYTIDLAGTLTSFNRAAAALFKYTSEEARGLNIRQIVVPEHLEKALSMVARKLSGEETPTYEIDVLTKSGRRVSLEVNTRLLLKDGKPAGIQGIARDITERKRKDEEMLASKERFSIAFNASPYPMSIMRISDRQYLDVNESAIRQLGFTREERIGKTVRELGIAQGQEPSNFWELFLSQGFVRDYEMEVSTKSGEKRLGLFSAEHIEIDGEPCALLSQIDITEQRRAERVKAAAYQISEAANSADNLQGLYAQIHRIVGELMDVRNFYIALVDREAGVLRIPYFVDEFDQNPRQRTLRKGLTEYVLNTQQPLHASPEVIRALEVAGEVEAIGTLPVDWLGVPLKTKSEAIGVLTVQSYTAGLTYGEEEKQILIFVSTQIALAIERKHTEEALRTSQQWFSKVFNLSPNPMGINRLKDGCYVDVNKAFLDITKYAYEEVIGKTPDDLGTWASPEQKAKFVQSIKERKRIHNLETDYHTKFGDLRYGLVSAEIIEVKGEEYLLATLGDITKRKLAENDLRASEERFSKAFNSSPYSLSITSLEGVFIDVNDRFLQVTGYTREELIGHSTAELDFFESPEARERVQEMIKQVGSVKDMEVHFRTKAGELRLAQVSGETITLGGEICWLATSTDITERKHTEAALMASEERFSRAFNLSPLPMHIISLEDTKYIYVNDSFVKATGYSREEMIGKTGDELNLWVSQDERRTVFSQFTKTGRLDNVEIRYRRKNGEIRTSLGSSELITLDGKPCALSVLNDITERKLAEEALRASEDRFSKAFNLSPLPMHIISLEDAQYIYVNDSLLKTTGYSREEMIGKTGAELNIWVSSDAHETISEIFQRTGKLDNLEVQYRRKNGEIRTALCSSERITLDGKRCALSILNDITERKRAEEALISSEDRFSKAFNLSPLPMSLISLATGRILNINDSFLNATGHTREEVIGQSGTELGLWVKEKDRDFGLDLILGKQRINNLEGRYRRKDGEIRTILFSAETITIDNDTCILTVINDITERKQKEEALRASEERFSSAFYLSPNPMCISTLEAGYFIDVNEAFAAALGGTRQELIGRTSKEINFFVDYNQRTEALETLYSKRRADEEHERYEIDNVEIRYRRLNGEVRTGLLSSEIIRIEGMSCLLTVLNDITERKKQEEELLVARREWQATFDALSDSVMLLDKDDRLLRANKAFLERNGFIYEEVVGRTARELAHQNSKFISAEDCPLCQLRAKKISGTIELPAGVITEYPVLASIDPILNSQGEYVGCVQVTRNLSALYSARQEAEQERISLKATIEQMAEGLMIFDQTPTVVRANSSAQIIFGFTLDEMINDQGGLLTEGRFADKDGRLLPSHAHPVRVALREQRTIGGTTVWYLRPDRQRVLLSITASPFFNEEGKLTGAVSLVRDVTQQQREMERLQQADKLRALGQLASGVAHNFNNALAAVIGYSQLALRRTEDPEVQKHLRVIEQSSKDAARMVERIQNFSRTRSKDDEFIPARILDIVRDAVDITRPRWQYDAEALGLKYTVTLQWQADQDYCVNCDPSQLREVFVNVIFNALDAMPGGGSLIIGATANQDSVLISFKDTGTGMTEEVKTRVFDPFFTTKGTAGLGLGLSESYRIIERHFGQLDAESQPNLGTTFTVTLPLIQFESFGVKRDTGEFALAKKRFLVIDDEKLVRYALSSLLEELGHEVFQAATAQQAFELATLHQFDLIFTDLAMPDIDGIATAQRVKAIQPRVKIVLMSGYSPDKVLERMRGTDCIDAPMSKPFRIDEVQAVIKTLVGAE
jgi:PAS domain S-box-containing protein